MKLTVLGTSSSYPTPTRGVSSLILQVESGQLWIFDTGEGTQIQLQKVSISRKKITKIFITHLHGDHLFGLPGLLCTISSQMNVKNNTDSSQSNAQKPLIELYGPLGLRKFLLTSLCLSRSPQNMLFKIHELEPSPCQYPNDWDEWKVEHSAASDLTHPSELAGSIIKPIESVDNHLKWSILPRKTMCIYVGKTMGALTTALATVIESFEDDYHVVDAGMIHHRIPSFGYVIREKARPGPLLIEKLKTLGVSPGPLYGKLKNGIPVTVEGKTIQPSEVIGPQIPGRTIVICGDTNDATPIKHLINECDVLVHEATHDDGLLSKAQEFGHSTPSQAAEFAMKIKAKVLLLNHFSQRYMFPNNGDEGEESTDLLLSQAKKKLEGSDTQVFCCYDLFTFDVDKYKM